MTTNADTPATDDPLARIQRQLDEIDAKIPAQDNTPDPDPEPTPDPNANPMDVIVQTATEHGLRIADAVDELRKEFPDADEKWIQETKTMMAKLPPDKLKHALDQRLHVSHLDAKIGAAVREEKKSKAKSTPPPSTPVGGAQSANSAVSNEIRQAYIKFHGKEPDAQTLQRLVHESKRVAS